jgi:hypothetical protein
MFSGEAINAAQAELIRRNLGFIAFDDMRAVLDAAAAVDGYPVNVATVTAYESGFEAGKDEGERERDSLRKALDDRWAADLKAAKEIFAETGRTSGFPSVKDVVGFYVAEVERLGTQVRALERYAIEGHDAAKQAIDAADSLRAKLERAKVALQPFKAFLDANEQVWADDDTTAVSTGEGRTHESWLTFGHIRRVRAVLSELSADAPAQQTQIGDEVREAIAEAEKALTRSSTEMRMMVNYVRAHKQPMNWHSDSGILNDMFASHKVCDNALTKLRSVMK